LTPNRRPTHCLLDIDGTLLHGKDPISGALEAVHELIVLGVEVAFVTNTTTRTAAGLSRELTALGLPAPVERIFTPASLTVAHIGSRRAALFLHPELRPDFEAVTVDEVRPEVVVMGKMGRLYDGGDLQRIFTWVMNGTELVALHKNRMWNTPQGMEMSLGGFVAAVEYATRTSATILGKPSSAFFWEACHALGVDPAATVMVGDDIEADVGGAQASGLKGVLVKTGKYRVDVVEGHAIKPDGVIDSVAGLAQWWPL